GDVIDSLRTFDPESQRSVSEIREAVIVPMRDDRSTSGDFRGWARLARERWQDERYSRAVHDRLVPAEDGEAFPGWEYLMPLAHPLSASVFDYLGDAVLVIDEPAEIEKRIRTILEQLQHDYERTEAADELALPPESLF